MINAQTVQSGSARDATMPNKTSKDWHGTNPLCLRTDMCLPLTIVTLLHCQRNIAILLTVYCTALTSKSDENTMQRPRPLVRRVTGASRRDPTVNTLLRRDFRSPLSTFLFFSSQFPPRTGTARIKYARHRHRPSYSCCSADQGSQAEARLSLTIQVKALCRRPAQRHGWRCRRPPRGLGRPARLTRDRMEPRIRPACPCRRCISGNGTRDV